jgi:predicted nucleotidyltransferase
MALRADRRIAAAYLFGSRATGEATERSDIDVAVLVFPEEAKSFGLWEELGLEAELSLRLGTDRVDVVVLNRCPLPLAYNIVAKGQVIYEADAITNMDFVEHTLDLYFDFAPRLQEYYREYDRSFHEEYSRAGSRAGQDCSPQRRGGAEVGGKS